MELETVAYQVNCCTKEIKNYLTSLLTSQIFNNFGIFVNIITGKDILHVMLADGFKEKILKF